MKKLIYIMCLTIFVLMLSSVIQCDLQTGTEKIGDLEAKVDALIKPYMKVGCFSGCILIARGGNVLLNKGYGMANYELSVPNTPQTKFHIASISKTFTAAAIMILQERGLLSVNDPLSKFIPDYPNGDKITVHHLLTHTSGIPNVNAFPEYNKKSKFPHTVEDIVEMFKHQPLEFHPGEKYSYSNSNYNLLAYIIEMLSGKSYGEFLKENIFDPLDMRDTGHHGNAGAILENRASGYQPAGVSDIENAPYLDWSIKTGNGSLYSTVEDLYQWDRALYTEKILNKSTLEKTFKVSGNENRFGWFVRERFNRRVTATNGRSPGFGSSMERFIDDDACIIILSNNYSPTTFPIAEGVAAIVFGEKYEAPPKIKPVQVDSQLLDTYLGNYKFGSDFYVPNLIITIQKRNEQLYMGNIPLIPLSETEFLERSYWAYIIFEKNDKGEVTQLIYRFDREEYLAKKVEDK